MWVRLYFILLLAMPGWALAQDKTCITRADFSISENRSRIEALVTEVTAVAVMSNVFSIIECDFYEDGVGAFKSINNEGIRDGNYIIFSPRWLQRVTGSDASTELFIVAHELGHFSGEHLPFDVRRMSRRKMELEADIFAGCQLARLGVNLDQIKSIVSRLRDAPGESERYPSSIESIHEISKRYESCSSLASEDGDEVEPVPTPETLSEPVIFPSAQDIEYISISKEIQERLREASCYNGSIDGLFGVGSVRGLERFLDEAPDSCATADQLNPVSSSAPVPFGWKEVAQRTLSTIYQCDPDRRVSCANPALLNGYSCDTNSYGNSWAQNTRVRVQNYLYSQAGCSESPQAHKLPGYRDGYHMAESPNGPWCGFAWGNVVLYYHNESSSRTEAEQREVAERLAQNLTSLTGRKFWPQKGGGMGVRTEWFDRTIIVHVRENPTGDSACQ